MKNNLLFNTIIIILFLTNPSFLHATENNLSWKDCVNICLSNNFKLKQARENLVQSTLNKTITLSSYFPQISSSYSWDLSGSESASSEHSSSIGLSGKQLIFDGLSSIVSIHRARLMEQVAQENYKIISANVRKTLRNAYADLLKANKLVSLTKDILQIRTDQYKAVKFHYQAGRENQGAVMLSDADKDSAKFEYEQAKRNMLLSSKALSLILGIPNTNILLKETLSITPPTNSQKTLDRNPQIIYSELQTAIDKDSLKMAEGAIWPQVSMNTKLGYSVNSWQPQWSVGLNIGLPLFEGFSTTARIKSARSTLKETQIKTTEEKYLLRLDIEKSLNNFKDSFTYLEIKKKRLEAMRERKKIADVQYSTGLITFDNWTIIYDNLVNSEKAVLEAQMQIIKAEAAYIAALGGTLEDEK